MRKLLIITTLCSGLCLVSCDKPDAQTDGKGKADFSKNPRGKRMLRDATEEQHLAYDEQIKSALRIESRSSREKALADIAWNAMESDPEAAHQAFQYLPEGGAEKIRLIQHYAMRLAEQNADEAIEWAETFENASENSAAIGHVALEIAEADPLRAAKLLSESGITGRDFDVVLVQVIQRWAAQSPQESATWVSSFPQGEARVAGIRTIMDQWLVREPAAAFGWLDRIEDESVRKETARVMQGVILQQPKTIRDSWLQHASAGAQHELQQQSPQAILDVGDNIPLEAQ